MAPAFYGVAFVAKGANNVVPASGGFDVNETLALIARGRLGFQHA